MYILSHSEWFVDQKVEATHFHSLIGLGCFHWMHGLLIWGLETLATPTVYGIVMYLLGHQQCCIPNYLHYLTYTGASK